VHVQYVPLLLSRETDACCSLCCLSFAGPGNARFANTKVVRTFSKTCKKTEWLIDDRVPFLFSLRDIFLVLVNHTSAQVNTVLVRIVGTVFGELLSHARKTSCLVVLRSALRTKVRVNY
jgi:hypothetical protein